MKITIEEPRPGEEDEIVIRCREIDPEILRLVSSLKEDRTKLTGYSEEGISMLSPKEIYYFESVDNKVFAYTKDSVFEIRMKLYELEEQLTGTDFLRISKSTIVNLPKVRHLAPKLNGRFEATMKNGEIVVISRQYMGALKEKLGI